MVAKRAPALGRLRTMSMMSSEHEINSTRLLDELAKQLPDESPLRIKSFNETHIECKPLGTGRFGDVFQYLNKQTNRFVAGKIVKMEMFNHYFQDWSKISLRVGVFLNELEILHKVSCEHERIANVTGIYSDYTQLIVFTEYLTNGSVKDILKDDKGLSEKTSLKYFYQICEALFYLHNQKIPIIHRDIKATNVLVDSFDNIKIANFGMVRDLAIDGFGIAVASEITVDFRGTMLYVAPEVLTSDLGPGNRNAYGKAADLWALGEILYLFII
uniref:Protein kinase domain-containing protein n=1 Tax=Rhabditophanes sp. KR3021 TaxID=114890 RepID=A0AC35TII8_9BILA